jgi:AraC family transcriptional regulator
MSTQPKPPARLGVRGRALRHQATSELAIAQLRPTVPEHELHRHQHAEMHLVLLLAGRYVSSAAGMPDVCAEPALVFNPPGTEHHDRFRSRDGLFITVSMPADAFGRLFGDMPVSDQSRRLRPQALSTAMKFLPEIWHWERSSPLAAEAILAELLAATGSVTDRPGPGSALQRVLDRLDDATAPLPSITELALIAGLHPVYMARAFRKHYGLSPSDYIRKRRLHRAVSLIAAGRTLAGIAPALGFVDESHLHRSFVGEYGMTPGAFRRLALGRPEVSRIQDGRLLGR